MGAIAAPDSEWAIQKRGEMVKDVIFTHTGSTLPVSKMLYGGQAIVEKDAMIDYSVTIW